MKGSRSGRSPQAVARSQAGSVGGHLLEPIHPQIHPYPLKRVLDHGGNAGLPGTRSPVQNHDLAGWTCLEHAFPPFRSGMADILAYHTSTHLAQHSSERTLV